MQAQPRAGPVVEQLAQQQAGWLVAMHVLRQAANALQGRFSAAVR